jgi:hypothetical protein
MFIKVIPLYQVMKKERWAAPWFFQNLMGARHKTVSYHFYKMNQWFQESMRF